METINEKRSRVMKTAHRLRKNSGMSLSESLKISWNFVNSGENVVNWCGNYYKTRKNQILDEICGSSTGSWNGKIYNYKNGESAIFVNNEKYQIEVGQKDILEMSISDLYANMFSVK